MTGEVKKRKKILIADDAEVFRRLEEGLLRIYGYEFVQAADGAQDPKGRISFVRQDEQLRTGHALQVCLPVLGEDPGPPLVLYAYLPLFRTESIASRSELRANAPGCTQPLPRRPPHPPASQACPAARPRFRRSARQSSYSQSPAAASSTKVAGTTEALPSSSTEGSRRPATCQVAGSHRPSGESRRSRDPSVFRSA